MLAIDLAQDHIDQFSESVAVAMESYQFDDCEQSDLTNLLRTVKDAHDFGALLPFTIAVTLELASTNDDWCDFVMPETLIEFFGNPYLSAMVDFAERVNGCEHIEHDFVSDLVDFMRAQFEKCYAD